MKVIESFSNALFDSDLIASRLALALGELCWAIMLFWPGETFDRPTYALMSTLAPELVWAFVFLLSSILQFGVVLFELQHNWFGRCFAAWNAALWVMSVGSMLLSVYPPPAAIGGEIALMVSAVWIWIRPHILILGYKQVRNNNVYS